MINELYDLSKAIGNAGISTQHWHREYTPIRNVTKKDPCVRILISDGEILGISSVSEEQGSYLRRFGNNQGSYPCLNLAALYRTDDVNFKDKISSIRPEELNDELLSEIKSHCAEDNWDKKFAKKYRICIQNITKKLLGITCGFEPISVLVGETDRFADPEELHQKLEDVVWKMLERRENVSLALYVLFNFKSPDGDNSKVSSYGTVSVVFDTPKLVEMGTSSVSRKFVSELNEALMSNDMHQEHDHDRDTDAFGSPFEPINEPMPKVKLAGGFAPSLRTMFSENNKRNCAFRYGLAGDGSYPISAQMRSKLQSALEWIGSPEQKELTWTRIGDKELLFSYPDTMPDIDASFTSLFAMPTDGEETFDKLSKNFIDVLHHTKEPGTDPRSQHIRVFVLKSLDKARVKVVYSRLTNSCEIENNSIGWTEGCRNLPTFPFGQPAVLFPFEAAEVLNQFRKQDGTLIKSKGDKKTYKPVPNYHGTELLLDGSYPLAYDMYMIADKSLVLAPTLGTTDYRVKDKNGLWKYAGKMLALMGLLLHRKGIRKDDYMENLPYLYGQLLKAADELHILYCKVVRDGNVPTQTVGAALYRSAAEAPTRTLDLLSQRIMPYYTWAKSFRTKNDSSREKEIKSAWYLYGVCEKIMSKLRECSLQQNRFNDEEKAQLFIGYLAELPKKKRDDKVNENNNMEDKDDE